MTIQKHKILSTSNSLLVYSFCVQEEIDIFNNAMVHAAMSERYRPAFRSLSWVHAILSCKLMSRCCPQVYDTLGSWHRMWLVAMENLLRLIDCRVTIPFWDFTWEYKDVRSIFLVHMHSLLLLNIAFDWNSCSIAVVNIMPY